MIVCSVCQTRLLQDFLAVINPESLTIKNGFVEPSLRDVEPTTPFQFEREGYFCADSVYSKPTQLVFNRTVGLRDARTKTGE